MSETPEKDPAEGPSTSTPATASPSPQEALRARLEQDAAARAAYALDQPLFPDLGPRCPRCGQRLVAGEKAVGQEPCPRCKVDPRSTAAGERLLPMAGPVREFFRGVAYLPRGALCVLTRPRLWKYAIVPLLLNVLVIGLTWFLADRFLGPYLADVSAAWEKEGRLWWFLSFGVDALEFLARWVLPLFMSWLIVAPPFNLLYKLMFMPVMELMTEATERIVLGFEDEGGFDLARFYANLVVAIVDAILLTLLQGLLLLILLPLAFIPIVNALWAIVPPSIFAGMDYSDINLVRRGYTTREKATLWRTYSWRFFGYGVTFFFLITLPLVNCFVIPAAAAGGALLYLELERK